MGWKRLRRQYYSKRSSAAFRKLLDRKGRYFLARSAARIRAYSKRRYG